MKKFSTILLALLFVPSISSAAALTQQQANSLIAVVQSSPGTPASAFVSLITAFSNITTAQATSLITVVQAAPGVSANAFVNLLTSFTVDTAVTQPVTPAVTPVAITPPAQTNQQTTGPVTPTLVSSTSNDVALVITAGQVSVTTNSAHIEWDTNLPTDSKVFVIRSGATVQVVQSAAGRSTHHFVDVSNLTPNTQYSYTIEAIAGTQDQKTSGVFTTLAPMDKSDIVVTVSDLVYNPAFTDPYRAWKVSVLDKDGNYIKLARVTSDPSTGGYSGTLDANGLSVADGAQYTNNQDNTIVGTNGYPDGKWYTTFTFHIKDLTSVIFTSGTLTKTVSI